MPQRTSNSLLPEWAPQQAVLLAWPHENTDWAPWLPQIEADYILLTQAISEQANALILCLDQAHKLRVSELLAGHCKRPPTLIVQPYNDTWCRDYGPLTLSQKSSLQLLNFQFNGWGEKYHAGLDNGVNQALKPLWAAPLVNVEFELEGGSVETDGLGTLLTTRHCLLESQRNKQFTQQQIETQILAYLGLDRVLWLSNGALLGDDTDSHIDNLARFCDPDTIAYASCNDPDDPHFEPLTAMEKELKQFRTREGKPYRLVPVEIPDAQYNEEGSRLPASYINFLILNHCVLVPVFNCSRDEKALQDLQGCFPTRKIVPVPGANLIRQFGGPHCATMQLPNQTVKQQVFNP